MNKYEIIDYDNRSYTVKACEMQILSLNDCDDLCIVFYREGEKVAIFNFSNIISAIKKID